MISRFFYSISRLIGLYSTLIWIRLMLTWLPSQRYAGTGDGPIVSFLKKICDPFLNFFRNPKAIRGRLDFSPVLAIMSLNILQSIFTILSQSGRITLGLIIALVVQGLWRYVFSYLLILLCIALAIRYICGRNSYSARSTAWINIIDPLVAKPVNFVAKIIYPKKTVSDQTYVLTALIFYIVVYVIIKNGLSYLINYIAMI